MGILAIFSAFGGITLFSVAVGIVRWLLAHRPIRVTVEVRLEDAVVLFAVTNQRQTAEFEGRVTEARGISEQYAWPWTLKWRHSTVPAERIAKQGTALLQVAEVRYFMYGETDWRGGGWAFAAPISVRIVDPSGKITRDFTLPSSGSSFYVTWSGIELDVELSGLGHRRPNAVLTLRLKFTPDQHIDAQIIRRGSS